MFGLTLRRNTKAVQPKELPIKEGDFLVNKEFGGAWTTIRIVKIGESKKQCLYSFLIIHGIKAVKNVHETSISFLSNEYRKLPEWQQKVFKEIFDNV